MLTNEELTELLLKAGITTADGALMPEEVKNQFIDTIVDQSAFLKMVTVERDIKRTLHLDAIAIDGRMLKKRGESGDITADKKPSFPRRSLTPVAITLPYDIGYDWLRKNIKGESAEEDVNRAFARGFRNQLVDLAFNGDTDVNPANPDADFLEITDGYIKRSSADADAHLFDRQDSTDWKGTVFPGLIDALPDKYFGDSDLTFFTSRRTYSEYARQLGERVTNLGDLFTTGRPKAMYEGIPIEPIPGVPYGVVILTPPKNLAIGFGDEFRVFRQLFPRQSGREVQYTIFADFDANYAVSDAVAYTEA